MRIRTNVATMNVTKDQFANREWPMANREVTFLNHSLFATRYSLLLHPSLAGLVVLAGSLYPIPSRTRP
jgi:hypothetical protein